MELNKENLKRGDKLGCGVSLTFRFITEFDNIIIVTCKEREICSWDHLNDVNSWTREINGQTFDMMTAEKCGPCGGKGEVDPGGAIRIEWPVECVHCNGTGLIIQNELKPKWTLNNPVLKLMKDLDDDDLDVKEESYCKAYVEILEIDHSNLYILAYMWGLKEALGDKSTDKCIPVFTLKGWELKPYRYPHALPSFRGCNEDKVCEVLNREFKQGWSA